MNVTDDRALRDFRANGSGDSRSGEPPQGAGGDRDSYRRPDASEPEILTITRDTPRDDQRDNNVDASDGRASSADVKPEDVATLRDLVEAGARIDWIWSGWLQRNVVTILASDPGVGKTRLVCDLIRRIRHGLNWPDGQPMSLSRDSKVLYIPSDNNHDELVSLAKDFDIVDAITLNAHKDDPYGGVLLETPEDFTELEARLRAVAPTLLVVDTTGNATDKDVARAVDAKAFFQPLQVLARRWGLGVLCLTHLNSGGGVLGRRAVEKARVVMRLERLEPDVDVDGRQLAVQKSNSKLPKPLMVRMGDAGNEYGERPAQPAGDAGTEGSGAEPQRDHAARWLGTYLAGGPKRLTEVRRDAQAVGISAKSLYAAGKTLRIHVSAENGRKIWQMQHASQEN